MNRKFSLNGLMKIFGCSSFRSPLRSVSTWHSKHRRSGLRTSLGAAIGSIEVLGNHCGQISAKLVGVGAASQRLIPAGERIWIAGAHRDDGKRFVVHADEKLTAFLELESATRACGELA